MLLGIIVFLWVGFWAYVGLNQQKFKQKASAIISERTKGDVNIGNISVSLLRTFPLLSLQLSKVVVRDSLYSTTKLDLLNASEIYLRLSVPGLITGKSPVGKVIIYEAQFNIITDSTGRSNEYVMKSPKHREGSGPSFPNLEFRNVYINYSNAKRYKLYKAVIRNMKVDIKEKKGIIRFGIGMDIHTSNIGFNTRKGSYLKDKNVQGNFVLHFSIPKDELYFDEVTLNIEDHPYLFNGDFRFNRKQSGFLLDIESHDVDFDKTVGFVHDSLQTKLHRYSFNKPIDVKLEVSALSLYGAAADVRIQSAFNLDAVERFAGITVIKFEKGKGELDLAVIGSVHAKDSVNGDIQGYVKIDDATIRYKRRNFVLNNCIGRVRFNNNDILIDTLSGMAGQTMLVMNGLTKNVFNAKQPDADKINLVWKISSPFVHLKDFMPFLSNNAQSGKATSVDKIFADADVNVVLKTPKMQYKNFTATNVMAEGVMKESEVELQKVFFNHAKGSMELKGSIKNGSKLNPLTLHTSMKGIDIPLLFASFDNFGQNAITSENLKGRLTAEIDYSTSLNDKAQPVNADSKGTIKFILQDGELNHFDPLEQVAKKAFKKQDFSEIKFADLKNVLQVTGTSFIVNPMEIRSTAFTLFVEGVYDYKHGTDMSIQLPLRNFTKKQANTDLSDEVKTKKGISLRLRAKTGDDGKLKVTWDPFRKAIKNRNDVKDSANVKMAPNSRQLKIVKDSIQVKK
ncbi:MAG: AsmA family protein [Flavitalea sp.]